MPRLLRSGKLTCHYCGNRSWVDPREHAGGIIRKWWCPHCESNNYLDERGEISDPPISSPALTVRYAQPVRRHQNPELGAPQQELFCRNCLKNQHLLTEALSSYLPSPDDPQYNEYEASVDEYRSQLEQRYPQVCENCIHRVRDRIRKTGYDAKADHLRRMMERTRRGGTHYEKPWDWRNLVISLAGQLYSLSIILGLIWHSFAFFLDPTDASLVGSEITFQNCVSQAFRTYAIQKECFYNQSALGNWGLYCGLLSFWWNPKLQEKVRNCGGRMVGLESHLVLQAITLSLRAGSLYLFQDIPKVNNQSPLDIFKGVHALMVAVIIISALVSYNRVQISHRPRFNFNDTIEPTLQTPPQSQQARTTLPGDSFDNMAQSFTSSFPIDKLASSTSPNVQYPPSPTIPSESESIVSDDSDALDSHNPFLRSQNKNKQNYQRDDDEMDWTPTGPKTRLMDRYPLPHAPILQQPQFQEQQVPTLPTKFGGKPLPPAPKAPAHQILNPFKPPVLPKVPESEKKDFFKNLMSAGESPDFNPKKKENERDFQFQQGKLQIHRDEGTGLESLFESVFNMKEEANEQTPKPLKTEVVQTVTGEMVEIPVLQRERRKSVLAGGGFDNYKQVAAASMLPIVIGGGIAWATGMY